MRLGPLVRWRDVQSPEPVWLSLGERNRLAEFTSPARRQQFVAGRWLMRELLAQIHGGEALQQSADLEVAGSTRLPLGHANLSHSGDWIQVVQADQPIGIDLERVRPRRDLRGLARMVHGREQCTELNALGGDTRLQQFYRLWTMKEAWLKARGRGLDMRRMRELRFLPCRADEADACSTLLPQAGLALALNSSALAPADLPSHLAGEPLQWQFFQAVAE